MKQCKLRNAAILSCVSYFVGCAFNVSVHRTPGAPTLPQSSFTEVLRTPPKGATNLGLIEAQGNNWQDASDCEAKLILEARKLGASALLIQPEEAGLGQGTRCSATAYSLK